MLEQEVSQSSVGAFRAECESAAPLAGRTRVVADPARADLIAIGTLGAVSGIGLVVLVHLLGWAAGLPVALGLAIVMGLLVGLSLRVVRRRELLPSRES